MSRSTRYERTPPPSRRFQLDRVGFEEPFPSRLWNDAYHFLRSTPWTTLTLVFLIAYLALNVFFAAVLYFGDAKILNAEPGFAARFVFSVQTMATVGYGYLAPDDGLAHAVVTVESFVSIVFNAVVTGVFFSKFSTPSAKVLWSRSCVVAEEDGVPTLMFRCANRRGAALVEASISVALTRDEVLPHGEQVRRIYDLKLRRHRTPSFALSWTVYHPIDAASPLHGRTPEEIEREQTTIIAILTGIDDTLAAPVHARNVYEWHQIEWNRRFVDIIRRRPDGGRTADLTMFHETREIGPY